MFHFPWDNVNCHANALSRKNNGITKSTKNSDSRYCDFEQYAIRPLVLCGSAALVLSWPIDHPRNFVAGRDCCIMLSICIMS